MEYFSRMRKSPAGASLAECVTSCRQLLIRSPRFHRARCVRDTVLAGPLLSIPADVFLQSGVTRGQSGGFARPWFDRSWFSP